MKNLFKTALITSIASLVMSGSVNAAVLNENFLREEIIKDIKVQLQKITTADIDVKILQTPYKSLEVPEGKVIVQTDLNLDYLSPRTLARVSVSVDGNDQSSFGVPVLISVKEYVWVAKEPIQRGSSLTVNNLQLEKRDITTCLTTAAVEKFDFSNALAKKTYMTGEIIDKRFVSTVPDVLRNNIVTVIFKAENLSLTLDAEAVEDGKIGDWITVKCKKYGKYYKGKVVSQNQVMVQI